MTAPLTVHNAEIRTATVEVKSLTVSGKQVTQSVFRQLQELPLIAEDGTLNGVPWGTVNYHPDKCNGYRPHWHVVWQDGTELRRSLVEKVPVFREGWDLHMEAADQYYSADIQNLLVKGKAQYWSGGLFAILGKIPEDREGLRKHQKYVEEHNAFIWKTNGLSLAVYQTDEARQALKTEMAARMAKQEYDNAVDLGREDHANWRDVIKWCGCPACELAQLDEAVDAAQAALVQLEDSCSDGIDVLRTRCDLVLQAEAARRERHRSVRQALADLPQLFIAV